MNIVSIQILLLCSAVLFKGVQKFVTGFDKTQLPHTKTEIHLNMKATL